MNILYNGYLLRNALPEDGALLAGWWNVGAVMAHAGFPHGLGTTPEQVAKQLAGDREETGRRLILEYAERPIGEMNYRRAAEDTAEIGIKICDAAMQNHGHGKVFLSMLLQELFLASGYRRVILDTNLNNLRAQAVYRRLGFREVGIRRDCWVNQDGVRQSAMDFVLTPEAFHSFAGAQAAAYPPGRLHPLKYTVLFVRCGQQWLYVRHKSRQTWETPGGHIEPGETAEACAQRELWEEAGIICPVLRPVCDYSAGTMEDYAYGAVFLGEISEGTAPHPPAAFEMAEARLFAGCPAEMTYSYILPLLFREAQAKIV